MDIENVFMSLLTLDIDRINSSIVYTPKYLNPSLIKLNFEEDFQKDLENLKVQIYKESLRRIKDKERWRRAWRPEVNYYTDIYFARKAVENIEKYVFNTNLPNNLYNSFLHYIKKTDKIWNHNFNDYFVKYKMINNTIQRI
jgi:hypothetical protein